MTKPYTRGSAVSYQSLKARSSAHNAANVVPSAAEGTIYDLVSIETGQPFVVRDSDLGNDEFIDGSFSWVDHGRHPGFSDGFDLCAALGA